MKGSCPGGTPNIQDRREVFGLRMVVGSGGRWHGHQRGQRILCYGKTPAMSSLPFLPSVSLAYRKTVSPGL